MFRKFALPLLALVLLFWMVGCSDNPVQDTASDSPNIEDEFGGYTASSEDPAFGDTELLVEEDEERDFDDPMLSLAEVTEMIEDPDCGFFHFRAVWGQLCYDSTVTEVTDWTGSLTITRGAEIVRRVIRFEPEQDYIHERTDRKLIEWTSLTTVHNDGVAIDIYIPPARPTYDTTIIPVTDTLGNTTDSIVVDTVWPEPVTVSFETGPYSRTFTLGELAALDTVVWLEDSNAVAFHGIQGMGMFCPRGFLAGKWGFDSTGTGVFRGRWISQHGFVTGYLRGHFGTNEAGDHVFRGKWISRNGRFEGFLRGVWGPHPDDNANGHAFHRAGGFFKGLIYSADKVEIGALRGRYAHRDDVRGGFFQGRWKLDCADADVDRIAYRDGF